MKGSSMTTWKEDKAKWTVSGCPAHCMTEDKKVPTPTLKEPNHRGCIEL